MTDAELAAIRERYDWAKLGEPGHISHLAITAVPVLLAYVEQLRAALRPFAVDEAESMRGYTNVDACRCKVMATFGDVRRAKEGVAVQTIRRFVIEGSAKVGDVPAYGGKPFRLLMDGVEVVAGRWGECFTVAKLMARDNDTITSGSAAVDVPAWQERFREAEWLIQVLKKGTALSAEERRRQLFDRWDETLRRLAD